MGGIIREGNHAGRLAVFMTAVMVFSMLMLSACSDALLFELHRVAFEENRPGIVPPSGTMITAHEKLTLTFAKSMETSTVSVSGDMGAPAADWDTVLYSNDTLYLNNTNLAAWTAGASRTLRVTVASADINLVYEFRYGVFQGICVSSPSNLDNIGSPTNPGTTSAPVDTVRGGITKANALYTGAGKGPSEVRIAKGTYSADYFGTGFPVAPMVEGVSLSGGYSPVAWASSNTTLFPTTLIDSSTNAAAPVNRCVDIPASVTSATSFENLTVRMSNAPGQNAAIYCQGSALIRYISIEGRTSSGDAGPTQYGIYCTGASAQPNIRNNTINAGWCSVGGKSYGIFLVTDAAPLIENNAMIDGGDGPTTHSIYMEWTDAVPYPRIRSNILDSGTGAISYGIYSYRSRPVIDANTFRCSQPASNAFAIFEEDANSDPDSVTNNIFDFNWGNWYRDETAKNVNYGNWDVVGGEVSTVQGGTALLPVWGNTSQY